MNDRSYVRRRTLPVFDALGNVTPSPLVTFVSRPSVFFIVQIASVLAVFLLLHRFVRNSAGLSGSDYSQSLIALEVVDNLGVLRLLLLAALAVALIRYGGLWSAWYQFENSNSLRGFVFFLCLIIAWPLVTAGYNYFFDQGYVQDRYVLIVMLALIWWRPVFVLPFVMLSLAMLGQLTQPSLGGTITAHKLQVLNVLTLFCATFFLHSVTGDRRTGPFIYLTCAMVAASYWLPALAKIQLDWLSHDHLYRMPLAAYVHGWLGHWSADEVVALAHKLQPFDLPMRAFVILLEGAFLVFLWRRGLSLALLIGVIVFHLAVFALYGFLFWPWIALDIALFVYLQQNVDRRDTDIYGWLPFLASLPLIGFGHLWAKAPELGWYDTPLSYGYRIDVVTDDGETLRLHPRALAPYEDVFTMASFGYAVGAHPVLVGPYGVTQDDAIAKALDEASNPADVFALEQSTTRNTYRAARARRLESFLHNYFDHHNRSGGRNWPWYWLHPPLQFWSHADGVRTLGSNVVSEAVVTEVTMFYDGETLSPIREIEVARVAIADGASTP